jgi:hypothetical protein
MGRSPWTARDALVPRTEAEAGASERAKAPAPPGAVRCTKRVKSSGATNAAVTLQGHVTSQAAGGSGGAGGAGGAVGPSFALCEGTLVSL